MEGEVELNGVFLDKRRHLKKVAVLLFRRVLAASAASLAPVGCGSRPEQR